MKSVPRAEVSHWRNEVVDVFQTVNISDGIRDALELSTLFG